MGRMKSVMKTTPTTNSTTPSSDYRTAMQGRGATKGYGREGVVGVLFTRNTLPLSNQDFNPRYTKHCSSSRPGQMTQVLQALKSQGKYFLGASRRRRGQFQRAKLCFL